MGRDFNTLEVGNVTIQVDRYSVVPGLGIFFFNGQCSDENLVYTAIGYEEPRFVDMGDSYHYHIREKKGFGDLYLKQIKYKTPTVKEGEHCIDKRYVGKISMAVDFLESKQTKEKLLEILEKPCSPEKFETKVKLLKELYEKSKLIQYSYGGYAQVKSDKELEWISKEDVLSYEEAYALLRELSNLPE